MHVLMNTRKIKVSTVMYYAFIFRETLSMGGTKGVQYETAREECSSGNIIPYVSVQFISHKFQVSF